MEFNSRKRKTADLDLPEEKRARPNTYRNLICHHCKYEIKRSQYCLIDVICHWPYHAHCQGQTRDQVWRRNRQHNGDVWVCKACMRNPVIRQAVDKFNAKQAQKRRVDRQLADSIYQEEGAPLFPSDPILDYYIANYDHAVALGAAEKEK